MARLVANITSTYSLLTGTLMLTCVYVPEMSTITGVMWYQSTTGSFTAANYNGVGLYSHSDGTLTLIASSTSDDSIWKSTASTINQKAFSSSISVPSGVYFIGALYNYTTTQTTQPVIGAGASVVNLAVQTFTLTNSNKFVSVLSSQTSLPSSLSMSNTTAVANTPFLSLY